MEGDKPTGCMVLVKYVQLKASMEERLKTMHENDPLFPMVDIMIGKISMYLNEALECDTLVLASIFHPGLRLKFFAHTFGNDSIQHFRAQDLLESCFTTQRDSPDHQDQVTNTPPPTEVSASTNNFLNFYNEVVTSSKLNELDRYIQGIDPMASTDMNDPQTALDWWKVSDIICFLFHFLFSFYNVLIILALTTGSSWKIPSLIHPRSRLSSNASGFCSSRAIVLNRWSSLHS
jgi:hypothetical protein